MASPDQRELAFKVKQFWNTRFRFYFEVSGTENKISIIIAIVYWILLDASQLPSLFFSQYCKLSIIFPNFMNKKTGVQRGHIIFTRSHSWEMVEIQSNPTCSTGQEPWGFNFSNNPPSPIVYTSLINHAMALAYVTLSSQNVCHVFQLEDTFLPPENQHHRYHISSKINFINITILLLTTLSYVTTLYWTLNS